MLQCSSDILEYALIILQNLKKMWLEQALKKQEFVSPHGLK